MRKIYKFIILGACFVLASCGNTENPPSSTNIQDTSVNLEQNTEESTKSKTLSEIYDEIVEEVELPNMVVLNENYIANYFGIDMSLVEDYSFANAEEVIYADTIIVMKAKDVASLEIFKEALQTMIDHKKQELENYLPEQFKLVEKSQIKTSGSYLYLVISENAEAIEAIIEENIK